MHEEDFDGKYVPQREVKKWMMNVLPGKITKEKLDDMRQQEVNENDMMQNTSIIYHPESVSEMQFMCLIVAQLMLSSGTIPELYEPYADDINKVSTSLQSIFIVLFVEHVATYFIELFRRYDIEHNGVLDINGIPRAKTESLLSTVQYFVICFLIGYIIKELIAVDRSHIPIR